MAEQLREVRGSQRGGSEDQQGDFVQVAADLADQVQDEIALALDGEAPPPFIEGDYDPTTFDRATINQRLAELAETWARTATTEA